LVEDEVIFEVKALEALPRIYEAQALTTYGGVKKRGLLEECPSKAVQRRRKGLIIWRAQRGGNNNSLNFLKMHNFSGFSVVKF
jgi:hypothetical protein